MRMRALIVEDEILTALHLETELAELDIETVGIAVDTGQAMALVAMGPDVAFVDVNLRDGPTGPAIAQALAQSNVLIFFITANPAQLPEADAARFRVIPKPFCLDDLRDALLTVH